MIDWGQHVVGNPACDVMVAWRFSWPRVRRLPRSAPGTELRCIPAVAALDYCTRRNNPPLCHVVRRASQRNRHAASPGTRYVSRRSVDVVGAIAAAAVIAAGCQAGHAAPPERDPTASAGPAAQPAQRFEVVAPVLYWTRTHRQVACLAVLASLPPAGCSGVRVTGITSSGR
jgi:hypothetical protein